MTQDELAMKLNVTRQAISNWEREITIPDINMITKISNIFDMSLDELILNESSESEKEYDRKATRLLFMGSIALLAVDIFIAKET